MSLELQLSGQGVLDAASARAATPVDTAASIVSAAQ